MTLLGDLQLQHDLPATCPQIGSRHFQRLCLRNLFQELDPIAEPAHVDLASPENGRGHKPVRRAAVHRDVIRAEIGDVLNRPVRDSTAVPRASSTASQTGSRSCVPAPRDQRVLLGQQQPVGISIDLGGTRERESAPISIDALPEEWLLRFACRGSRPLSHVEYQCTRRSKDPGERRWGLFSSVSSRLRVFVVAFPP
jgi:hypothetical protein